MLTPRKYQEEGINFLLKRKKVLLADAPGLGKSYQATETIERADAYPALVLCPAHLVDQWAQFIKTQYPHRTVSYALRADFYLRDWALTEDADFYVANIEMLRNVDFFSWPRVKAIVYDESHHLKNRNSKQSQGALKLIFQSKPEYVLCLSATPIKREADDLFAQLRLLRPDIFTSYNTFVNTFCDVDITPWDVKVLGIKDKEGLMKLLELVMLRREYVDVNMQLPELIESTIPIEFNEKQRKSYDTLKNDLILSVNGLDDPDAIPFMWAIQALQTLRQMTACDEKIQACVDLALDAPKPVVFCHYKATARRIAEKLKVPMISGEIPAHERIALAKAQPIIVATIDSITEGVDLSNFDTVIFAEEDYTPGVNYQALSRVRRSGANVDVPIIKYCVHVADTIDETVHAISQRRDASAQSLLRDVLDLNMTRV